MPLLKIITDNAVSIGIWRLTEPFNDLISLLTTGESDRRLAESYRSEQRKREFLAVRILLTEMLGYYPDIKYDPDHKPFMANSTLKLSISHSRSLAAVLLAPVPAGVDTEETTRNVSVVAHRFLSGEELEWISETPDPNLTTVVCWSMKESVFKMAGTGNSDFRSDIRISPFVPDSSVSTGVSYKEGPNPAKTVVHFLFEDDNVVTWCLKEDLPDRFQADHEVTATGLAGSGSAG